MLVQLCLFVDVNPAHLSSFNNLDKIDKLPGQPKVGFQQFSGYVSVDDKKQKSLFYYFVEAEVEPASKPLVLWLNGGLYISCFLFPQKNDIIMLLTSFPFAQSELYKWEIFF